ncbi:MAG: hypothetical protein Q9227_002114 [Pyrenula ochraceoflavens]
MTFDCPDWANWDWNASYQWTLASKGCTKVDPDISGIGVTIGIVCPALLLFLAALVAYFTDSIPEELLNNVDQKIVGSVERALQMSKTSGTLRKERIAAFKSFIILLGDQMMITGVALIIAGYAHWFDITIYSMNVAGALTLLSSSVHLTVLPILFSREAEPESSVPGISPAFSHKSKVREGVKIIRFFSMIVVFVGMSFLFVLGEGNQWWPEPWYSDLFFLSGLKNFTPSTDAYYLSSTILNYFILLSYALGYVDVSIYLFTNSELDGVGDWLLQRLALRWDLRTHSDYTLSKGDKNAVSDTWETVASPLSISNSLPSPSHSGIETSQSTQEETQHPQQFSPTTTWQNRSVLAAQVPANTLQSSSNLFERSSGEEVEKHSMHRFPKSSATWSPPGVAEKAALGRKNRAALSTSLQLVKGVTRRSTPSVAVPTSPDEFEPPSTSRSDTESLRSPDQATTRHNENRMCEHQYLKRWLWGDLNQFDPFEQLDVQLRMYTHLALELVCHVLYSVAMADWTSNNNGLFISGRVAIGYLALSRIRKVWGPFAALLCLKPEKCGGTQYNWAKWLWWGFLGAIPIATFVIPTIGLSTLFSGNGTVFLILTGMIQDLQYSTLQKWSSPAQPLPPTHLALRQETYATPPAVTRIPTPQLLPGTAILRVQLAAIISYTRAIYDGSRAYPYPTPLTLGSSAIARVAAGGTEASKKLMEEWRDGTYAEFVRWPLENCHVLDEGRLLGEVEEGGLGYKMEDLMFVSTLMVPYGGLGPGGVDVKPGETVVVAPATGSFGSAAVHVCLELGAGRVVCMGRNREVLERLKMASGRPERVSCVPLTGDWEEDFKSLRSVSRKIDVFFDISPPAAKGSGHLKAAIMALRHGGRACLMGGLREDVGLPCSKIVHADITIKGKWMCRPVDIKKFIELLEMGVVKMHETRDGGVKPLGGKCTGNSSSTSGKKLLMRLRGLGAVALWYFSHECI